MKRKSLVQIMYEQMQVPPALPVVQAHFAPVSEKEAIDRLFPSNMTDEEKNIYLKGEFPND